tara:strand:- start:298 stop:435 length:138 start_codon:yes stop_codon:yes gene_type:complete
MKYTFKKGKDVKYQKNLDFKEELEKLGYSLVEKKKKKAAPKTEDK